MEHSVVRAVIIAITSPFISPLKAWRVPVWSFDHFCSPYMDGRMRIVMVEDNALLEEVSVVGYGTTREWLFDR